VSDDSHAIIAVIPLADVKKMLRRGWQSGGKTNGSTETLVKVYPSEESARQAGYKLRYVYGIERFPVKAS
jgi:hypothetical protein